MSSMSNEVDYRLARIIFADMCEKRVIRTKKETGIVQVALLERYDPPFAFLESDTHSALSEDDFTRLMGTKLVCGRCGRNYGVRPWHSTTYNDRVYECRSKSVKKGFCGNSHIYEEFLPEIIKSVARQMIKKRHSVEQFIMNTHQIYDNDKLAEVHRYLGLVLSDGLSDLTAARDGLHYIISGIVVLDGVLEVRLVDETSVTCEIPEYKPRRNRK